MKNKPKDIPYCGVSEKKIQEANPVLYGSSINLFMHYLKERYKVHIKKDVQRVDPPWTEDKILAHYKFTNIRREHDRETLWLIHNISNNAFLTYRQKILNTVLFRLFNKHETMEIMGAPFKFEGVWSYVPARTKLYTYSKNHPKYVFFTNAFITAGLKGSLKNKYAHDPFAPGRVLRYIAELNRDPLISQICKAKDQKEVYSYLKAKSGIGEFLAYQIYVDLTYIEEFPFSENEFTIAGPGCKNGLNFLFKDRDGMTYEECLFWIRDNWYDLNFKKNFFNPKKEMIDLKHYDRKMNVMSLENCFCEFSKYYRAVKHIGRPNRTYASRLKAASQVEEKE